MPWELDPEGALSLQEVDRRTKAPLGRRDGDPEARPGIASRQFCPERPRRAGSCAEEPAKIPCSPAC